MSLLTQSLSKSELIAFINSNIVLLSRLEIPGYTIFSFEFFCFPPLLTYFKTSAYETLYVITCLCALLACFCVTNHFKVALCCSPQSQHLIRTSAAHFPYSFLIIYCISFQVRKTIFFPLQTRCLVTGCFINHSSVYSTRLSSALLASCEIRATEHYISFYLSGLAEIHKQELSAFLRFRILVKVTQQSLWV